MAFNTDKDNLKSVLTRKDTNILPENNELIENKKTFSFTLQPSIKQGLDKLASEQGYKNTSQFLNDLIKQLVAEK